MKEYTAEDFERHFARAKPVKVIETSTGAISEATEAWECYLQTKAMQDLFWGTLRKLETQKEKIERAKAKLLEAWTAERPLMKVELENIAGDAWRILDGGSE